MPRRLILLIIGILTLFALSAWATETRVATMGNSGLYLKDDVNMFTYPGTMTMYKKLILAEHYTNDASTFHNQFTYSDFRRVGIVMPAWHSGVLAIFAGQAQEHFAANANPSGSYSPFGFEEPTTRFLVGYGMNSGNASLGFQVDFSGVRDENNPTVPQTGAVSIFTAHTWGFGIGLSTPMGDLNNLDFGFRLRIGSFKSKQDSTGDVLVNKSNGNTALSFHVRDYYALNDYVNLVPVGALGIASEKNQKFTAPATDSNTYKFNTTSIEGGLGLETKPTEGSEIIGGVGYRYSKLRQQRFADASGADSLELDNSFSTTALPFAFLGFEAGVKSWMHFRLGVEKEILTSKNKTTKPLAAATAFNGRNEWKVTNSPLTYAVGVGIKAGPVTMDAQVDNSFFNMGPNFLSGNTLDADMFPRVSFTYNFK